MADEVKITVDGVEVTTAPGKMVLEAASDAGIYVPYLCYHPGMKPFGACRMCVVEIDGVRGTPASCTVPVQDGMIVRTQTDEVYQIRRGVMEMEIAEHPHGCLTCHRVDLCGPEDICLRHVSVNDRCVTCPKNERCELKDTVRYHEMELESPLRYQYRNLPIDVGDPFYDRDYNLCIVCGRCVRVCEEVRGDDALTFVERAGQALVGTSQGTSLLESGCEFCGACLDVCPVGALVESDHKWDKPSSVERTTCPQCPVGCQLNLEVNSFGKIIRTIPELSGPPNKGQACFKGKFGLDFVNHKDRLKKPQIRKGSVLEEVDWEQVIDVTATKMRSYSGDNVGVLTSPTLTNEEHYLAQKFARLVMKSNNIDQGSNLRPDLATPLIDVLGYAAGTNTVWELEGSECILMVNANVTEEHNVVGVPIKRATRNGSNLIVIDPREVELTRYANLWLRPVPGTELLLLAGIIKSVIDQGLVDKKWIKDQCDGGDELVKALGDIELEELCEKSGINANLINEAAKMYGAAGSSAIVYALDNISPQLHRSCVYALADLALLTGNIGKQHTGLYPLRGGANEQGAYDMGCVPNFLPGYQSVQDSIARRKVEQEWQGELADNQGLGVREMIKAAKDGTLKAMVILGSNPTLTSEDIEALKGLDFLVVQDIFHGPLTEIADVILPAASFAEKEGTYTNIERRVQLVQRAVKSPLDAKPELFSICQLAQAMDHEGFAYETPDDVLDELSRLNILYRGISMEQLEKEAVKVARPDIDNPLPTQVLYSDKEYKGRIWPSGPDGTPGEEILYAGGFPDVKAKFVVPDFQPDRHMHDDERPLTFVPGRVLLQMDRGIEIIQGEQNTIQRDEILEMHPDDATPLGISEGDDVEIFVNSHKFNAKALISDKIHRGTICSTSLFGQLATSIQSDSSPDPMANVPGLDIVPAKVNKL